MKYGIMFAIVFSLTANQLFAASELDDTKTNQENRMLLEKLLTSSPDIKKNNQAILYGTAGAGELTVGIPVGLLGGACLGVGSYNLIKSLTSPWMIRDLYIRDGFVVMGRGAGLSLVSALLVWNGYANLKHATALHNISKTRLAEFKRSQEFALLQNSVGIYKADDILADMVAGLSKDQIAKKYFPTVEAQEQPVINQRKVNHNNPN